MNSNGLVPDIFYSILDEAGNKDDEISIQTWRWRGEFICLKTGKCAI